MGYTVYFSFVCEDTYVPWLIVSLLPCHANDWQKGQISVGGTIKQYHNDTECSMFIFALDTKTSFIYIYDSFAFNRMKSSQKFQYMIIRSYQLDTNFHKWDMKFISTSLLNPSHVADGTFHASWVQMIVMSWHRKAGESNGPLTQRLYRNPSMWPVGHSMQAGCKWLWCHDIEKLENPMVPLHKGYTETLPCDQWDIPCKLGANDCDVMT